MTEPLDSNSERKRIVRGRNLVLGLLLGAFVILVYAISIAKMN
jgi:hypothetical protein